jgi:L-fucose isomerase-like protein
MNIVYCPVGVPTFDLKVAQTQFENSVKLLRSLDKDVIVPEKPLLSIEDLDKFLESVDPLLIVFQNLTFANSQYCTQVMMKTKCPVLLWTLKEPVIDGTRLRLNSLTGAFSAANVMTHLGRANFEYIFGSPEDVRVKNKIESSILAAKLIEELRHTTIAAIGSTPQGFGFGRALDAEIAKNFGSTLISVEARELMNKANSYEDSDVEVGKNLKDIKCSCLKSETIEEKNLVKHSKLLKAYVSYIEENNVKILASRCWPDFFTEFKTPVCAVLSLLNDMDIASACESDLYGGLSMHIAKRFSNKSTFFGDPVSMDEEENTITFWHCGMAAPSLASSPTLGLHPNRKMGPVMDFGLKASKEATVFRVGRESDSTIRLYVAKGEILEKPKQFTGTSVVVKTKSNATEVVDKTVRDGWEPHYVVAYGDIVDSIKAYGKFMNFDVIEY